MAVAKSKVKSSLSISATGDKQKLSTSNIKELTKFRPSKLVIAAIIIIILAILISYKKDWFIAANVNGSPIMNWDVIARMNTNYRKQTIEQMVNEKLIYTEAAQKGVRVNSAEVNEKIKEIETQLGGADVLNNLLSQQGQTLEDLKGQIKLQLTVEKMFASDAQVTDDEINKFIEENKDQFISTDSAQMKKEAGDALKQQKLSQAFSKRFQEIKQSAKVQTF